MDILLAQITVTLKQMFSLHQQTFGCLICATEWKTTGRATTESWTAASRECPQLRGGIAEKGFAEKALLSWD